MRKYTDAVTGLHWQAELILLLCNENCVVRGEKRHTTLTLMLEGCRALPLRNILLLASQDQIQGGKKPLCGGLLPPVTFHLCYGIQETLLTMFAVEVDLFLLRQKTPCPLRTLDSPQSEIFAQMPQLSNKKKNLSFTEASSKAEGYLRIAPGTHYDHYHRWTVLDNDAQSEIAPLSN